MTTTRPLLPALQLPAVRASVPSAHRRRPVSVALTLVIGLFALPWYLATRHLPEDPEGR